MRLQVACFCLTLFFGTLSPGEAAAPFVPGDVLAHPSDTVSFRGIQKEVRESSGAPLLLSERQSETLSYPARNAVTGSYASESSGSRAAAFTQALLLSSHKADTSSSEPSPLPPTGDQDGVAGQSTTSRSGDDFTRVHGDRHGVTEELTPAGAGEHISVINEPDTTRIAPLTVDAFFSEESHHGWGLVPRSSGRTLRGGTSSGSGAPLRTLRDAWDDDVDKWHQQATDSLSELLGQRFGDDPEIMAVADSITVDKVTGATAACPSFVSTWSRCSSGCGRGSRYQVLQEARGNMCAVKLSTQGCTGISKCTTPQAKWDALGISKPPEMPEVIYLGLADKLPPEDEWDFVVEHGKVYQIFQSGLSPRYLKGQVLSDDACGLAVRSFFTVAEETLPTGRQFLNKFIMLGAYIPCPGDEEALKQKTEPLPQLSSRRAMPPLPSPSPGPYKVQEDRGSSEPLSLSQEDKDQFEQIRDKVLQRLPEFHPYAHQLQPTKFRQSSIARCPFIETTSTACTSSCGLGRMLSFRVAPDGGNVCRISPALAECEAISGCPGASSRWRVFRLSRPSHIPSSAFDQLAMLVPPESSWKRVEMPGTSFCDTLVSKGYTDRFRRGGNHEVLADDAGGSAVRAYFVREVREVKPGVWRCVSFLGLVDADVLEPIPEASSVNKVLVQEHNHLRRKYGVHDLRFDSSLKRFAEYWAWRLEQDYNCGLHHSDSETRVAYIGAEFESTGENLSVACTAGDSTWEGVPAGWFEEVHCYKYGKVGNPCTSQLLERCDPKSHAEGIMVGHFTQVMSELSNKVGCAVRYCAEPCKLGKLVGQRVLTVCNYANSGNVVDKVPFSRRVAARLESIHPEIFEAPDDPASRAVCQRNLKEWEQLNPGRDI